MASDGSGWRRAVAVAAAEAIDEGEEAQMVERGSELLARRANVLADWADRMPLRNVYIFGDHAGGDAATGGKLTIAIEYNSDVSDEILRGWQRENSTGFEELQTALGIRIALFTDQDYDVWPAIRDAVRDPLMTIRKVRVVQTPAAPHGRHVGNGTR